MELELSWSSPAPEKLYIKGDVRKKFFPTTGFF